MTTSDIAYNWSDAWVLLSIVNASKKGDATLPTIIAAGDGINPAMLAAQPRRNLLQSGEGFFRLFPLE